MTLPEPYLELDNICTVLFVSIIILLIDPELCFMSKCNCSPLVLCLWWTGHGHGAMLLRCCSCSWYKRITVNVVDPTPLFSIRALGGDREYCVRHLQWLKLTTIKHVQIEFGQLIQNRKYNISKNSGDFYSIQAKRGLKVMNDCL